MDRDSFQDFKTNLRQSQSDPLCPVLRSLEVLHGKWTTRVIFQLLENKPMRFGALRRSIPTITNTMLASTLRTLEEEGLVLRQQFDELPPRVEYSLTQRGQDLLPVFYELDQWWITSGRLPAEG